MAVTLAKRITSDNRPMPLDSSQPAFVYPINTHHPARGVARQRSPMGVLNQQYHSPSVGLPRSDGKRAVRSIRSYKVYQEKSLPYLSVSCMMLRQLDDRPAHVLFSNASHSSFLIEARMSTSSYLTHNAERMSWTDPEYGRRDCESKANADRRLG